MRKYWRFALIVTAVLSCILMIIYRQKYQNLNSVLELMNIFKFTSDKNTTICQKSLNHSTLSKHLSFLLEEILNLNGWTEIFHGIYSYSPHFTSKKVVSVGYTNLPSKELEYISCKLWYENHTSSVKSTFKFFVLDKYFSPMYYMTCFSTFETGFPYAISFEKNKSSSSLPVFSKQFHTGSYTVCVKPLSSIFFDAFKILEFIIYHSHIGIKHFIFYYTTMTSTVKEMLINIAAECGIYIELLPWMVPLGFKYNKLKLDSYTVDCLFRVSSGSHNSFMLLLDLDHYLYINEKTHIKELIYSNSPFDFLQLQQKMFCSEFSNNIFVQDLNINFRTLSKTKVHPNMGSNMNVIFNVSHIKSVMEQVGGFKKWFLTENIKKYNLIEDSYGVIFSYTECGAEYHNKNTIYTENDKMWKFKEIFYKDCAYLLAKKSGFIED